MVLRGLGGGEQDEMLRELRDRMEQLMHGAAARAAEADVAEDGSAVLRLRTELERLRSELAKKDALLQQLQSAHAQVKQVPNQAAPLHATTQASMPALKAA